MAACRATRRDGQPCGVQAMADGFCFAHSPLMAKKRRDARVAGGRNSAIRARMVRKVADGPLAKVQQILLHSIAGVLQGTVDPRQATAVAALSGALVRVYELNEQEAALADALERVAALERSSHSPAPGQPGTGRGA